MATINTTEKLFGKFKSSCENCTYSFKENIAFNISGWTNE